MLIVSLVVLLTCSSLLGPFSPAAAQSSPVRQPDGTQGLLSPLGGNEAIYSDAHGNKQPTTLGSGLPSHGMNTLSGVSSGALTPFGTPTPPNRLTPAPLLPLSPKWMTTPQPQRPTDPGSLGRFAPPGRGPSH
ncbi:exported hypothetical protein [Nitrospira defluvii]|uniref:Uncharacterized protein n=1 Tax=Nitrospira defluvii TaxID=330214 RepID=A0ABM8RZZ7_9BACT|nr:exported hypothetical protein [Nitrospira defluvii]